MATQFLRVLVKTVAIRDEPGSTDRQGDFNKDDAVKLVTPCGGEVPEWVEVDMVGAVRAPTEEGQTRPATGFVRTRNRVCSLLEPWTDTNEASKARDDQASKRDEGTSWFKSSTRTAATAAAYAKPLLAGGREEYERRQRLCAAAADIVRDCQMGPVELRQKLLETFEDKDWAAAHLADDKTMRGLHIVAERDARAPAPESSRWSIAAPDDFLDVSAQASAPPPPSPAARKVKPPPSPARALVAERKAAVGPGSTVCELGAATEVKGALGALVGDGDVFGELWVRLPFAARAALAQASRGVCKAARGVPWRRQCVALADACGVLDAAFSDGATIDAVDDDAWRGRFVDVWTNRRHKWRGGAGGSFSIRAVVRFRPRQAAVTETENGGVFLPLHQRLQLRKLGHNAPCLETEVAARIGAVDESVETYADRQRRRRSEARRNTDALRQARKDGRRRNSENVHPNCEPAPAAAEAPAPALGAPEAPAPAAAPGAAEAPAPAEDAAPAEADPRSIFAAAAAVSAKVLGVEDRRVLVGVPGTGLSYFNFEKVLDGDADQAQCYDKSCAPLVKSFCDGTNGCLLAYGQTGSGKTHTMFGPPNTLSDATHAPSEALSMHAGVVPRALADCLKAVDGAVKRGASVKATLSFVYLELYREQLTDLLSGEKVSLYRVGQGAAADEYREKTGCDDDVLLGNATHFDVTASGARAAWAALAQAETRKRQEATAMNARSSRAHTVFALSLTQRRSDSDAVLTSKLYLCDLGGSEQVKKSKATGQRFQEVPTRRPSSTWLPRDVETIHTGCRDQPLADGVGARRRCVGEEEQAPRAVLRE